MQAITTRYHGATNYLPSRISATSANGTRIYESYDYGAPSEEAMHREVARRLIHRLGWEHMKFATGQVKNGDYVHVFITDNA